MLYISLTYFSMMLRLDTVVVLLVVIITSLLLEWMKSAEILDFTSFNKLLIFIICMLAWGIMASKLLVLIKIMTYFLEELLIVILILSLFFFFLLFTISWISTIFLASNLGKVFLVLMISFTFFLEACMQVFLLLLSNWFESKVEFFIKNLDFARILLLEYFC